MSAEVTKVTIKIGETEISLSPEEARGLRDALSDLLGSKTQVVEIRTERVREYPWIYPYWTIDAPAKPAGPYEITCRIVASSSPVAQIGPLAAGGQA